MTDDLREAAQLVQRDIPAESVGTPRLFVAHLVGEVSAHGYATRAMRLATWADVEALRDTLK